MKEEDLEDVLEELYSAGTFDSSGDFTLSAEKAREKLAKFTLENPHDYVGYLYSAGYMAGATSFRVELGLWSSRLEFPEASLPLESLRDPFSFLIAAPSSPEEWALHELALGLHTGPAAGLKSARILLGSQQVVVSGGRIDCKTLTQPVEQLVLVLSHTRKPSFLLKNLLFFRSLPEWQALQTRLTQGVLKGELAQRGRAQQYRATVEDLAREGVLYSIHGRGFVSLGVGQELGRSTDSSVELCIRGRKFPLSMKFGKGRVRALIVADELRLDLGGAAPLENRDLLDLKRTLLARVSALRLEAALEKPEIFSDKDRRTLFRQVSRGCRSRGDLDTAIDLLHRVEYSGPRLASIHFIRGEDLKAEKLLRAELERDDLPQGLRPARLFDLAGILARRGSEEALSLWEDGYAVVSSLHAARKPHLLAEALESKLFWMSELKDERLALELWEEAVRLKSHLGQRHLRFATTFEIGAYLHWRTSQFEKAESLANEAIGVRTEHLGPMNPALGPALTLKALACKGSGQLEKAIEVAERRLSVMQTVYQAGHPEEACSRHLISWLSTGSGDEQATASLRSLAIAEPTDGRLVVCFRNWFHSRSPWSCVYPLTLVRVRK